MLQIEYRRKICGSGYQGQKRALIRIEYWKLHDAILDFFYEPSIDPKDTLLFYFSGHGVLGDDGEHYLSTSGIDPDL